MSAGDTVFSSLKDFQRDTVNYVLRRLYDDPDPTDRFLVADEVGMGKTLVARGVIAGAIERLERDPKVDRIDVIYICSNADIARQNVAKLRIGDGATRAMATRLTLLATQVRDLNKATADGSKIVNLVAFTPGTSFDRGSNRGRVAERALLWWLLRPVLELDARPKAERRAVDAILQMGVSGQRWENEKRTLDTPEGEPSVDVATRFRDAPELIPLRARLEVLIEATSGSRRKFTADESREIARVVGELRHLLARVSITSLEPDLIILDEFQRFRHLLKNPDEGAESEVSQLANEFFSYENAKVLLLSATPYKMVTLAEERALSGDRHYDDFLSTVEFLQSHQKSVRQELERALSQFRSALVSGADPSSAKATAERILTSVMCRTERPSLGDADMLREREAAVPPPSPDDLSGFVAMRRIAIELGAPLSIEYWKSAPYFLNFMDGYQVGRKFREADFDDDQRRRLIGGAQLLDPRAVAGREDVEAGNARLRALVADTIDSDLWKLLWLPPSMPYYESAGPYSGRSTATTKRLIFSSWAAAPTAIAALLSHAASVRTDALRPGAERPTRGRLNYRMDGGRPAGMSSLALFVPIPHLAERTDPLDVARSFGPAVADHHEAVDAATRQVAPLFARPGASTTASASESPYVSALFWLSEPGELDGLRDAIADGSDADDSGLAQHLQAAAALGSGDLQLGALPQDLARSVAAIGFAGPGNVAWRAVLRTTAASLDISPSARLRAAAIVADGFRSMFNRPDVMSLIDGLYGTEAPYWQNVLLYCLDGNLQAVMDEYLHHLVGNESPSSDDDLIDLARRVRTSISLRTGSVQAFNPADPSEPINFPTRFAVRYGTALGTAGSDDKSLDRLSDVQAAFNSPFWPMVLASTSIGQEGVDFHWWCHSIVHWNLPSNPVDIEQREGRVHRYKGHAVRKNVATAHRAEAFASSDSDPWSAAFDAARSGRQSGQNDLVPWWVYPGEAKIERWVPSMPLSREIDRARTLQEQRAVYRLAFGQPRQEDLMAIVAAQERSEDEIAALTIDLRPPSGTPLSGPTAACRNPDAYEAG